MRMSSLRVVRWSVSVDSGDTPSASSAVARVMLPQRIGSGVAVDGRAFMPSDAGVVQCLDPQTGKVLWQERPQVPGGQASTWSSIVLSGDRLYVATKNSDTIVLRAGPKFEQL